MLTEIRTVQQMDALGMNARPEDMDQAVRISSDLQQHVDWLAAELERFDAVYIHGVSDDQSRFIEAFGSKVLPALR